METRRADVDQHAPQTPRLEGTAELASGPLRGRFCGAGLCGGDLDVRFGGRPRETDPEQSGRRAPGRPNRLNPQITVGLLTNATEFPLAVEGFEGNRAEPATMLPVINTFKTAHQLTDVTVVAPMPGASPRPTKSRSKP
jgi:hypothetical protein